MKDWICDDRLNMNKLIKYIKNLTKEELEEFEKKNYTYEQLIKMFGYD